MAATAWGINLMEGRRLKSVAAHHSIGGFFAGLLFRQLVAKTIDPFFLPGEKEGVVGLKSIIHM